MTKLGVLKFVWAIAWRAVAVTAIAGATTTLGTMSMIRALSGQDEAVAYRTAKMVEAAR